MKDWEKIIKQQEYLNSPEYLAIKAKKAQEIPEFIYKNADLVIDHLMRPLFQRIGVEELLHSIAKDVWQKGGVEEIRKIRASTGFSQSYETGSMSGRQIFHAGGSWINTQIDFGYRVSCETQLRSDWIDIGLHYSYSTGKEHVNTEEFEIIKIMSGLKYDGSEEQIIISKQMTGNMWSPSGNTHAQQHNLGSDSSYTSHRLVWEGSREDLQLILAEDCRSRTELGLLP